MKSVDIYSRLLELPLFVGMSKSDFSHAVGRAKFEFLKHPENKTFIREGDVCRHLCFLLEGEILATRAAEDRRFVVSERVAAPDMLQIECLWGLRPRHTYTFTTLGKCLLVRIDKEDALRLVEESEIFRLNMLNAVTAQSQQFARQPWRSRPQDIRQKLVSFFDTHCRRPAGEKLFRIKMEQLAREIGESRLNVSRALHVLQEERLLTFGRAEIHIPALEKMR